ncbi:DUF3396 domain-containing protein [Archangium violaceum]|uniref:type VI immunity family protein n=1 Tax=Archangium violaceum TaxID=83451 RepID=UPI002B308486|nr:DUF3396 domain-containing protein [Archangium gephyra]
MSKEFRLSNEDDGLFLRDSFVIVFFCKKPFKDLADNYARVFEHWLEATPEQGRKWASVGSNSAEYKPLTPQRLAAARKELDPAKSNTRRLSSFEIGGPQQLNPDFYFACWGFRDPDGDKASFLEIRLPRPPATASEVAAALTLAKQVGAILPFSSGYASPALTWGVEGQQMAFAEEVGKLAFRHPGYDVPESKSSCFRIGNKLRGTYWLNFIGPAALKKLGGEKGLRGELDASIGIEKVGDGLMLQAGPKPEVGDVNRKANLPLLRSLAKVLEPVTLFDDNSLDNNFIEDGDCERWKRRHLE